MKKLIKLIPISFCMIAALLLQSCKDDCEKPCNKDCETYDPCACETPLNADFVMEEKVWERWFEIGSPIDPATDIRYTVTTPSYDSCVWLLGSETIRQKQFTRRNYPLNTTIKPMLIVYKSIDPKCAGKLKSVDTLVKTFTTLNLDTWYNKKAWQLYGTYKGYKKSNPNKEITVTIDTIGPTIFNSLWGTYLTNIPYNDYYPPRYLFRPDGTPEIAMGYITHRGSITFASTLQTTMFEGYGTLKSDELNIVYSYHQDTLANGRPNYNSPLLQDEFIGTRIKQ
jgi:hypothetical protein